VLQSRNSASGQPLELQDGVRKVACPKLVLQAVLDLDAVRRQASFPGLCVSSPKAMFMTAMTPVLAPFSAANFAPSAAHCSRVGMVWKTYFSPRLVISPANALEMRNGTFVLLRDLRRWDGYVAVVCTHQRRHFLLRDQALGLGVAASVLLWLSP